MARFQIVSAVGTQIIDTVDPIAAFDIRGFSFVKPCNRPGLRVELQGQPMFAGLNGPMWGGHRDGVPVIRYEDGRSYEALCA